MQITIDTSAMLGGLITAGSWVLEVVVPIVGIAGLVYAWKHVKQIEADLEKVKADVLEFVTSQAGKVSPTKGTGQVGPMVVNPPVVPTPAPPPIVPTTASLLVSSLSTTSGQT